MKYCFIINPKAGDGTFTENLCNEIHSECQAQNKSYDIYVSESIDGTREYVLHMAEKNPDGVAFLACGGDGTLCKTVLAVMRLPAALRGNAYVGVVPMGTGNDFVSNFTAKHNFSSIKAQLNSTSCEIDLLKCNDMYSINMVNIGFDSHVVCKKEEIGRKKWLPRKFAYIFSLIITLIRKPGVRLELLQDGEKMVHKNLLLTTLANGSFCGGGFHSNPLAILNDGRIDCVAVKNISRTKFISMVGAYKKGRHLEEKFKNIVEHFKCRRADMYFDKETPVSIDGEIIRTKELHISVERNALKILLPHEVLPKVGEMLREKLEANKVTAGAQ